MQSSQDLGNTFGRAWQLLASNWSIIVPAVIFGIVGGIVNQLVANIFIGGGAAVGSLGSVFLGGFLLLAIATIVEILTVGYTTGMGLNAWRTGKAQFSDGAAVFSNGPAVTTILIWIVVGIVLALIPVLGWIAGLVLFFLWIYAVPSAVVNSISAGAAFGESMNIVTRNFIPTLLIVLLIGVIGFAGALVGAAFTFIPFLGKIVAEVIQAVVVAYATLVIVGEYLRARVPAAPPPSAT